jgi:uncharacterized C2H2 Zn-finger protein
MSHTLRQFIYIIKPNLDYIKLLENRLKNYKFYCIKVKLGTQNTNEFYNFDDIKIVSPFLHERQRIKCQICFIREFKNYYKAKTFDLDFELKILVKCLKCGSIFNTIDDYEKHKLCYHYYISTSTTSIGTSTGTSTNILTG